MLIVIRKLLHEGMTYSDPGGQLTPERIRHRMSKCIKGLESLGFRVIIIQNPDIRRSRIGFRECELNGANPFDYLNELQRHAEELKRSPAEWMAWNYRQTLERLATPAAA
jgi:hypothetical protein